MRSALRSLRRRSPFRDVLSSPILRFYVYRFFVAEGFVFPVITLFLLDRGVSLAGVGLAAGSFFAGTLLGEIPTGYVGDRIGRRNGLVVSSVLVTLTHLGFAHTHSLAVFAALWGFWGVANTFRSGSTDAWLYDALLERDDAGSFTRASGRSTAVFYGSAAITALVGGWLYELRPAYPFFAAAAFTATSAVVCLTLPEPDTEHDPAGFTLGDARDALTTVAARPSIRAFVLLVAAAMAVPETIEVFVQPIARDIGFSPTALGPLYAALLLFAAGVSSQAERVRNWLGSRRWFALSPAVLALVLVAATVAPLAAVPAFFLGRGFKTITLTLGSAQLNERIASEGRATVLSAASMVYAFVFLLSRVLAGTLADATTPLVALAGFGIMSVTVTLALQRAGDPFATNSP